jgi:hypothetical protein
MQNLNAFCPGQRHFIPTGVQMQSRDSRALDLEDPLFKAHEDEPLPSRAEGSDLLFAVEGGQDSSRRGRATGRPGWSILMEGVGRPMAHWWHPEPITSTHTKSQKGSSRCRPSVPCADTNGCRCTGARPLLLGSFSAA